MVDCLSRSSTLLMADSFRLDVKNAVQLAVYDCVTINAKNHHIDAHTLVEKALEHYYYTHIDIYFVVQVLNYVWPSIGEKLYEYYFTTV